MEFGMPTMIENETLEQDALLCKQLGLSFLELNMNLPQYQMEELERTERFLKIAATYGMYYTIHLEESLDVCGFNQSVTNAYLNTVRRTIRIAKSLHIPVLNMHMSKGIYFTLPNRRIYLYEKYEGQYMAGIRAFITLCEKELKESDIKISIENTDGYETFQKHAIDELLKSDVFTLTWDVGHSFVTGEVDVPYLMKYSDKIRHMHIHDALGEKNHLTLGTGKIPLQERLSLARQNQCRIVIETKTIHSLKNSISYIRGSM